MSGRTSGAASTATTSSASSGCSPVQASPCSASGATATPIASVELKRLLRPLPHLERHPLQHALLIGIGATLAGAALIGIAWAAGFDRVLDVGDHVNGIWLPIALGMEIAAYLGYIVAYREI